MSNVQKDGFCTFQLAILLPSWAESNTILYSDKVLAPQNVLFETLNVRKDGFRTIQLAIQLPSWIESNIILYLEKVHAPQNVLFEI